MAAPQLNTPIDYAGLHCTQPAMTAMYIKWAIGNDLSMSTPIQAFADVHPYDPDANKSLPRASQIDISDLMTLAGGLAQAGRPQLATALQAILDAMADLVNNGIPPELSSLGTVSDFSRNPTKEQNALRNFVRGA